MRDYRVLYGAAERLAAFIEVLAPFRPVEDVRKRLDAIQERDPRDVPPGVLPGSWTRPRTIGRAVVTGTFADITHAESIAYLRGAMAAEVDRLGVSDITAAMLKGQDRDFTRAVSRHVFKLTTDGRPSFAGIQYRSRHGDNYDLWAVFERQETSNVFPLGQPEWIRVDDADLKEACEMLGLQLDENY